ncbi:MAG: aminotransferase class I/II-fold pyridoxal phosphate-dependent enzyme [Solirubrobacteraceae bacterium]|nr:aminotransferase class I/II-fold pyridoxal phosphate-dependent enzyme [Solirubrobacteraceae bacterium]
MRLSPVLAQTGTYPFVRLREARLAAEAAGADVIDFGIGEPREETPVFIRRALADAVQAETISGYPSADGLPETRAAIAAWTQRRFGASLDVDTEVVPTLGSKEVVFGLAQVVGGPGAAVGVPTPGYPVPARGAVFAGARVVDVPLTPDHGWLPDLDALPGDLALLWLNYPNNPTGARAPLEFLARAQQLALARGFVVACDEAYSELWFDGDPPHSALELADRRNLLVLNTLSKRSSMPGFRAGFAAGDPELIAALKRYRPNAGVAPPAFVQRAAVAAWGDETHVEQVRARYRAKRDALLPALLKTGLQPAGGDATFFLWMRTPAPDDEAFSTALLAEHGVVVAPGSYLGEGGRGHVRIAVVPTLERCQEAAGRLSR